jgi:hypothetical protein
MHTPATLAQIKDLDEAVFAPAPVRESKKDATFAPAPMLNSSFLESEAERSREALWTYQTHKQKRIADPCFGPNRPADDHTIHKIDIG